MKPPSGLGKTLHRLGVEKHAVVGDADMMEKLAPSSSARVKLLAQLAKDSPHIKTDGTERPELALWSEAVKAYAVVGPKGEIDESQFTRAQSESAQFWIALMARPAISYKSGKLVDIPEKWKQKLVPHQAALEALSASVGRIEPSNRPEKALYGTAFMVAEDILMTNVHVVKEIADFEGSNWTFRPAVQPRVDFRAESRRSRPREFKVAEVLHTDEDDDLALLRVSSDEAALPAPVPLASEYYARKGRIVCVIGYPTLETQVSAAQIAIERKVFADKFDVKRVSPGRLLKKQEDSIRYDASTLAGNSGSCVVDLSTGQVIGLHRSGSYLNHNTAAPLWRLKGRSAIKRFALNYV